MWLLDDDDYGGGGGGDDERQKWDIELTIQFGNMEVIIDIEKTNLIECSISRL